MQEIQRALELLLPQQDHFDHCAVGVIDFAKSSFETCGDTHIWFDLASVTKVLGHSAAHAMRPDLFTDEMRLLLEHRAGLPAWGLLPKSGWQEIILSYKPKAAETLYSDYSAMRVSLELAKKGHPTPKILSKVWGQELCFWKDLPNTASVVKTGEREGRDILGEVHDPNAWVIGEWCGHAGLFGTVKGVCQTLLNLQNEKKFIKTIQSEMKAHTHRFIYGWDRVENPAQTLAGSGCSASTFGHLGFTGTSVWIDAEKMKGHVILTNATRDGWYCKAGLQELRAVIGNLAWKS